MQPNTLFFLGLFVDIGAFFLNRSLKRSWRMSKDTAWVMVELVTGKGERYHNLFLRMMEEGRTL